MVSLLFDSSEELEDESELLVESKSLELVE